MAERNTASLPGLPKGTEFEEYIAAVYQSSGFFVERDIVERDGVDLLQLDVLVTNYSESPPLTEIIEAKSGDWGSSDIFKIGGWIKYLGLPRGHLIVAKERTGYQAYAERGEAIGVELLRVADPSNYKQAFAAHLDTEGIDDRDVAMWRFCYWAERVLLQWVKKQRKSAPEPRERFDAIVRYAFAVHDQTFFAPTVADRVSNLYGAYAEHWNLAARCASEIQTGKLDPEAGKIPENQFSSAFYRCAFSELQTACYIEHYARLALLKSAVDYLGLKRAGEVSKAHKVIRLKMKDRTVELPLVDFPKRFKEALLQLEKREYLVRYPVFWQWFLGVFGGFLLTDYETQEKELLARKSGIPADRIDEAFSVYDLLYPIEGGWFRESKQSNTRVLMLYPCPLRGVGANYRRLQYTDSGSFDDLRLDGEYTDNDLSRWNNALVELLCSVWPSIHA